MKLSELLQTQIRVINVGLDSFSHDLERQGVPVVHVQWTPPARGNARLATLLSKLGT